MKVKFIVDEKKLERNKPVLFYNADYSDLTFNKEYVVMAITKWDNVLYFYVLGDESIKYPLPFPIQIFEVIDSRFSEYWNYSKNNFSESLNISEHEVISFNEWSVGKDFFYEKILDEDSETLLIFIKYRDLMINEF